MKPEGVYIRQTTSAHGITYIYHCFCVGKCKAAPASKPFNKRASFCLYLDLLHLIVGLNFCTKTYTQHHNRNPLSKCKSHTINRILLLWVVGGQWIWEHIKHIIWTHQRTSNTKYGYEKTHQRCQRETQTHKKTFYIRNQSSCLSCIIIIMIN